MMWKLWDLLEGKALFNPIDARKGEDYDDQAHLGQVTALLGPAPRSLLDRGRRTALFYHGDGLSTANPLMISLT